MATQAKDNGRTWASWSGMYNTRSWKSLRKLKKQENPTCELCRTMGKVVPMDCVDHIIAINEENFHELFLDWENLQSLCYPCHGFKTARDKGDKNLGYKGLVGKDLIDDINMA